MAHLHYRDRLEEDFGYRQRSQPLTHDHPRTTRSRTLSGTLRVPVGTRSLTSTRPFRETRSAGSVTGSINAPAGT